MTAFEDPKNSNLLDAHRAGFFRASAEYWWGSYRQISVTGYEIEIRKLALGQRLKIAFVSDLHADTRFMPARRIQDVVAKTNALGSDLIVLGGDYSAQNNWRMTQLPQAQTIELLSALRARLGVVAILGNHDWWDDPQTQTHVKPEPETAQLMRDAGITVLRNQAFALDGTDVQIIGLDSHMAFQQGSKEHEGAHDLGLALQGVGAETFNILLAHEPDIFADLAQSAPRVAIDLTLSGHTHGGQIRIFKSRPVVPSAYGARYAYGHLREDGRDLIVSGGLGCSSFPIRMGVLPEIVSVVINGSR